MDIEVKEINNIDTFSKFYCVVNKPLYYICTILAIVPVVILSTVVSYEISYILFTSITVLYCIIMYILYKTCYNYKQKHNKLKIIKVKASRKIGLIFLTFAIVLISTMIASFVSVLLVLNGLN